MRRSGRRQFNHDQWADLKALYKYRCVRCTKKESKDDPASRLTVDHVIPIAWGGSKGISNVQPLCLKCNQTKASQPTDYRWRKFKT